MSTWYALQQRKALHNWENNYGRLEIFGSFCWKTPMPIKFLLLGGGAGCFLEEGVEVPILFLWAWGFFRPKTPETQTMV